MVDCILPSRPRVIKYHTAMRRGTRQYLKGRPYPTHTTLGKLMHHGYFSTVDVQAGTGIYVRTLTEYLAGRKTISGHHRRALAEFFELPESVLDLDPVVVEQVLAKAARRVVETHTTDTDRPAASPRPRRRRSSTPST